jgi:hypothetical protein
MILLQNYPVTGELPSFGTTGKIVVSFSFPVKYDTRIAKFKKHRHSCEGRNDEDYFQDFVLLFPAAGKDVRSSFVNRIDNLRPKFLQKFRILLEILLRLLTSLSELLVAILEPCAGMCPQRRCAAAMAVPIVPAPKLPLEKT